MALSTASLVVAGVSVKAQDVFEAANDVQKVANVRQLATALELYYSHYENYPQVEANSSLERWDQLISSLKKEHLLVSLPPQEGYDYQDFNFGQNYLMKVLLENPEHSSLHLDWDGTIEGLDCNDPNYCLKM